MFCPRPGSDACISVTTARMSAIARDTLTPERMSGSARQATPPSRALAARHLERLAKLHELRFGCLEAVMAASSTGHSEPKRLPLWTWRRQSQERIATGMSPRPGAAEGSPAAARGIHTRCATSRLPPASAIPLPRRETTDRTSVRLLAKRLPEPPARHLHIELGMVGRATEEDQVDYLELGRELQHRPMKRRRTARPVARAPSLRHLLGAPRRGNRATELRVHQVGAQRLLRARSCCGRRPRG